jgi:hypothetical protein
MDPDLPPLKCCSNSFPSALKRSTRLWTLPIGAIAKRRWGGRGRRTVGFHRSRSAPGRSKNDEEMGWCGAEPGTLKGSRARGLAIVGPRIPSYRQSGPFVANTTNSGLSARDRCQDHRSPGPRINSPSRAHPAALLCPVRPPTRPRTPRRPTAQASRSHGDPWPQPRHDIPEGLLEPLLPTDHRVAH